MISDDEAMMELAIQVQQSRNAGFRALCLKCRQGFNGPTCPRCWPPTEEAVSLSLNELAYVGQMDPHHFYAWLCVQIGATMSRDDAERWMAVRTALDIAIRDHGHPFP